MTLVMLLATGCEIGSRDNPRKKEQPTAAAPAPQTGPTPATQIDHVQLCMDVATLIRFDDDVCDKNTDGYRWMYVTDFPQFPVTIPAVGDRLEAGRGTLVKPENVIIARVPSQGGIFAR